MSNNDRAVLFGLAGAVLAFVWCVVFIAAAQAHAAIFCFAVCLVSAGRAAVAMVQPRYVEASVPRLDAELYAKVPRPPVTVKAPPADLYSEAGHILLPGRLRGSLGSGAAATNKTAAKLRTRRVDRYYPFFLHLPRGDGPYMQRFGARYR